jgi:hypothetical protein
MKKPAIKKHTSKQKKAKDDKDIIKLQPEGSPLTFLETVRQKMWAKLSDEEAELIHRNVKNLGLISICSACTGSNASVVGVHAALNGLPGLKIEEDYVCEQVPCLRCFLLLRSRYPAFGSKYVLSELSIP